MKNLINLGEQQQSNTFLMGLKVFISGASSGIGEHLAYSYASKGAVVGICARREEKLIQVAQKCKLLGGSAFAYTVDVTNSKESSIICHQFIKDAGGIDVVIANAGVGSPDGIGTGDPSAVNNILKTNILGVTNIVIPFIPRLKKNKGGKIAIISSVASFTHIPFHGAYSSSKVAVKYLAYSWRVALIKHNIKVSAICPGFVKSEMTDNKDFKRPFFMDTDIAAEKIKSAIEKGKRTYIFPWQWRIIVPIMKIVPDKIYKLFIK